MYQKIVPRFGGLKKVGEKCLSTHNLHRKTSTVRVAYCEPPWDQKSCS